MVKYVYDAWGNHVVLDPSGSALTSATHIGNLNPFRYRGYYYDVETGLYYLQTRYYDPVVGRFTTIDDLQYLDPEHINGLNLYAYCANNPVMNVDPEGTKWWKKVLKGLAVVATVVAAVAAVVGGIVATIATWGAASPLVGLGYAALGGALFGFAGGVAGNLTTQIQQKGWKNVDLKETFVSGGIGAIGGAITGVVSFGVGKIAEGIGNLIGFTLGNMTIMGTQVAKIFSSEILMAVFGKVSSVFGAAVATYFGDYLGSNLFQQSYTGSKIKETTRSVIFDWLLQFGRWLYSL